MRPFHLALLSALSSLVLGLAGTLAVEAGSIQEPKQLKGKPVQSNEAQIATPQRLPAEVEGWADAATAAYRRGNLAEALHLQKQVAAWLRINRGPMDAERARSLRRLGILLGAMGRPNEGLRHTEQSAAIFRELANTDSSYLGELAVSLTNLAVHARNRNSAQALEIAKEAIKIARDLIKAHPGYRSILAATLNNAAVISGELGLRSESIAFSEESVAIRRELVKGNPAETGGLAKSLYNLGVEYGYTGRQVDALTSMQEAVRIQRELAQANSAYADDLSASLNGLGVAYSKLGRQQEALAPMEEALMIRRGLAKRIPAYLADTASSMSNLGTLYGHVNRLADAAPLLEEAVLLYRDLAKNNPAHLSDLASSLNNLGNLYSELKRPDSTSLAQEAVSILKGLKMSSHAAYQDGLAKALISLGNRQLESGDRAAAKRSFDAAIEEARSPHDVARALGGLSIISDEKPDKTSGLGIIQGPILGSIGSGSLYGEGPNRPQDKLIKLCKEIREHQGQDGPPPLACSSSRYPLENPSILISRVNQQSVGLGYDKLCRPPFCPDSRD